MSCIELSKDHYQYVADTIYHIDVIFKNLIPFKKLRNWLWEVNQDHKLVVVSFINELQLWNTKAYDERYGSEDPDYEIDYVKHIKNLVGGFNGYQFFKCLECIDYQCSSTEFRKSGCRELLLTIMADCRSYLIEKTPEYKEAKWNL